MKPSAVTLAILSSGHTRPAGAATGPAPGPAPAMPATGCAGRLAVGCGAARGGCEDSACEAGRGAAVAGGGEAPGDEEETEEEEDDDEDDAEEADDALGGGASSCRMCAGRSWSTIIKASATTKLKHTPFLKGREWLRRRCADSSPSNRCMPVV